MTHHDDVRVDVEVDVEVDIAAIEQALENLALAITTDP